MFYIPEHIYITHTKKQNGTNVHLHFFCKTSYYICHLNILQAYVFRPVARIESGGMEPPPQNGPFGPKKWTFWTSTPYKPPFLAHFVANVAMYHNLFYCGMPSKAAYLHSILIIINLFPRDICEKKNTLTHNRNWQFHMNTQ